MDLGAEAPPAAAAAPGAVPGRPLRILVHGLNFAPELTGIGRYTGDMAAWLVEQGHEVTVVTAYPYYPHWKLAEGWPAWRWSREGWRGVRVLRCPLWVPRRPNGLRRILHLLSFAVSSGPVLVARALLTRRRPDIVFVVEPTSLCAPWALLAARLTGARAWLHVQDLELGAATRLGMLGDHAPARVATALYGCLLRAFDRVTTLSDRMRARLAELGRPVDTIGLFANWVDTDTVRPVDAGALRRELGIAPSEVMALYAGNMGEKQGIEGLVQIARLLVGEPGLRFVFCGAGSARSRVEAAAAALPNVNIIDPLPDDRFTELLSAADIHLLPQRRGMTYYVMPSKLGPMMASGRPIVAQAEEGCPVWALLTDRAVVVEPEDDGAFVQAVLDLASSSQRRALLGRRAQLAAVTHLSRTRVLRTAFEKVTDMTKPSVAPKHHHA